MAKRKISCRLVNHGMYDGWDGDAKSLPRCKKSGDTVPAVAETEFGYIVNIRGAKGKVLAYRIEHPPFLNDEGEVTPAFEGDLYVRTNDWDFYLGDKVWEPVDDKVGKWRLITKVDGEVVEDRTFEIVQEGWGDDSWVG